jgi:FeS assembly SUF system protein
MVWAACERYYNNTAVLYRKDRPAATSGNPTIKWLGTNDFAYTAGSFKASAATERMNKEMAISPTLKEQIITAIQQVHDPEIPVNIYELGLIYEINISPLQHVQIVMTLTSPSCPAAELIPSQVEAAVRAIPGIEAVEIVLTFDPPYSTEKMSEAAKLALGFL